MSTTKDKIVYNFPCINCNQLVHINEIDSHSNVCFRFNETKNKLDLLLKYVNKIKSPFNKYLVLISQYLSQINTNEIVDDNEVDSLLKIKQCFENLNNLLISYTGSFDTLILIERAKQLIKEKVKIIQEQYENKNSDYESCEERDHKKEIYEKIKNEEKILKTKIKNLKNNGHRSNSSLISLEKIKKESNSNIISIKLEELCSDIDSISMKYIIYNFFLNFSSETLDFSFENIETLTTNHTQNEEDFYHNLSQDEIKNLFKQFSKLLIKVKFEKILSSHPGQKIPEKILFKECVRNKISKKHWDSFILDELNNYLKYTDHMIKTDKVNSFTKRKSIVFKTIND